MKMLTRLTMGIMCLAQTSAFSISPQQQQLTSSTKAMYLSATSSTSTEKDKKASEEEYVCGRAESDGEIMDIASFRNDLTSPEMLVAKQQEKRDEIDKTADAVKGVGIGLAVGAVYGVVTYLEGGDLLESLTNFAVLGGVIGSILGINNIQGKSVYVASLPEAENRLKVDYVEGLAKKQDLGFYGQLTDVTAYNNRFKGCNGVVGCIDCQLRNCDDSANPKRYGNLPPHVHIKNLSVDSAVRRKGIARKLVQMVEDYAKEETEANLITIVVDDFNDAAINLYSGLGYTQESIGSPVAQQKFGQWTRGRSAMTKIL